jgi:hypothetical protein
VLRSYVQDRLSGAVRWPDGGLVTGPDVPWVGRRKDRRWAQSWSPEQISHRLRLELPDDESMRVSHEAIYQSLYVQGRGALRRELTACLRTGRALRVPRGRARRGKNFVTEQVLISERPAEAEDRAVPGSRTAWAPWPVSAGAFFTRGPPWPGIGGRCNSIVNRNASPAAPSDPTPTPSACPSKPSPIKRCDDQLNPPSKER